MEKPNPVTNKEEDMVKKSWSRACRFRAQTRILQREKRRLKKLRAKRSRRNPDEFRKTYARDII